MNIISSSRGKARIGVLVPFTNSNLEADFSMLRPDGVSIHYARMGGYDQEAIPDSSQMANMGSASLDEPLKLLTGVRPNIILYGCTSATLSHGMEFDIALANKIKTLSGVETVTAAGALVYALNKIKARHISFASPYVPELNDRAIALLSDAGFETIHRSEVKQTLDNYGQSELSPEQVYELGLAANHQHCDAIVLSCTDMRSVEIIAKLEQATGKPVITSNQALMLNAGDVLNL